MSEAAVQEREHTNPLGYPVVKADNIRPFGDKILLAWEEAQDEFKLGRRALVRPSTTQKQHYTGKVLAIPTDEDGNSRVDPDIKIGTRIFFEQFAGFEKWFDPKYGRLALIRESDALLILPPRTIVQSVDGDYNYSA